MCAGLLVVLVRGSAVESSAAAHAGAVGSSTHARYGGIVRVALRSVDVDSLDPALAYSVASFVLLDTTCALLVRPTSSGLQPEVATGLPRVSRDLKTYT